MNPDISKTLAEADEITAEIMRLSAVRYVPTPDRFGLHASIMATVFVDIVRERNCADQIRMSERTRSGIDDALERAIAAAAANGLSMYTQRRD